MTKKLVAVVFLLLFCLSLCACGEDMPKEAVAKVGTGLVLKQDLDSLVALYQALGKAPKVDKDSEQYHRLQQELLQYLVTLEIVRQEASDLGLTVTESDVQAALGQIKQMFQNDAARYQDALKRLGLDEEQLRQALRDRVWLERAKSRVTGEVVVTDEEAQAYYEEHKSDYVEQESRKVRHILVSPYAVLTDGGRARTASAAEWEAARTEAGKVRREILNGLDFVTAAEKYSDDDATKESGGDLGAVVRGMLVPEFEKAVFALSKGEVSEPVKTQYGYHVIQVTDITPETELSFEQVKEKIRSSLLKKKQEEAWSSWLALAEARVGVQYRSGYAPTGSSGAAGDQGGSAPERKE